MPRGFSGSAATWAGMNAAQRSVVSAAHPRDPVLAEYFGGGRTMAGVSVTASSAMRQSAVYACVGLLADSIASLPLNMVRKAADESLSIAADHPLYTLLHDQPNPDQTSIEWRQDKICHLALRGNAYDAIVQNPGTGKIEALVPLHPDRTRPFRFRDGGGVPRIAYEYMPLDGPRMVLTDAEVVHIKRRPFTPDGLRGTSPIDLHRQTIGSAIAAQDYGAAFFGNNAAPNVAIEVPGAQRLDDEARKLLREDWEAKHRGPYNAGRLAILDLGMKLQTVGMSNEDAQYIDARRFNTVDIARLYGVPPHMIGETGETTAWGTGIEQLSIGFVVYTLRPWFVLIEQALEKALLLPRERASLAMVHDVDELLRGDFKTRMDGFATMVQWGIGSRNEVRRKLNMPRIEGGDEILQPLNMAPATKALEVLLAGRSPAQQRAINDLLTRLAEVEKDAA